MNQFNQTEQSPEQLTKQNPNTDLSKVPHPINIHVQTVQTIVQMGAAATILAPQPGLSLIFWTNCANLLHWRLWEPQNLCLARYSYEQRIKSGEVSWLVREAIG